MAANGEEPVASMGNDAALAVLSDRQPPLFSYFKQLFAQVTNPPIDPIRENVVMSLQAGVGAEVNLLDEVPEQAHQLVMDQPILRNHELEKLRQVSHEVFDAATLDITWPIEHGPDGMEIRLYDLCEEAATYVDNGANILILSDRNLGPERVAMPSLLAVAAVHHHLVRRGTRLRTGLVIESGEPRDIHHMATLIGYGAAAINPYVMFESLDELADRSLLPVELTRDEAEANIVKAIGKGLVKTISKMGISTIQSYCGAQIFEAVGSRPAGGRDVLHRHRIADRRGGARAALDRGDGAPLPRLPADRSRAAAGRRRAPVAPRRRAARLEPGHGRQAPACDAGTDDFPGREVVGRWRRSARDLQGVRADGQPTDGPQGAAAGADAVPAGVPSRCRSRRSSPPWRS